MADLKIGIFQFYPKYMDPDYNYEKVKKVLESVDADVIVLPELPFTGYNFDSKKDLEKVAENPFTSPGLSDLIQLTQQKSLAIVTGFAEKEGAKIFNSALFIANGSIQAVYRKTHLFFREKDFFIPGDTGFHIIDYKGAKFSMMVCFDWYFPEVTRLMALQGVQIVCHPSNLVLNYCQNVMVSRSIENLMTIVTANRIGSETGLTDTLTFTGQSQIVAPRGNILYRGPSDMEDVAIRQINPADSDDKLITSVNHLVTDRRPEFYRNMENIRVK